MKLWASWGSVHRDSFAQDSAAAKTEPWASVTVYIEVGLMGSEMFLLHIPFPKLTSLFLLCCRTHCLISCWLLKAKLSVQGLLLHPSLQSGRRWCQWIPEHLSWDGGPLFLPLLLLACMGHVNVFQYETLGFRALRCQVRSACEHLLQAKSMNMCALCR